MNEIFNEQINKGTFLTEEQLKEISKKCFDDGIMRQFEPGEICITFLVKEDNKPLRMECTSDKCIDTLHKYFILVSQSRTPIMEYLK